MEAEIKLLLPSAEALRALASRVGASGSRGVEQRNYFFDTSIGAVHALDCHIRLRHESDLDRGSGRWVLTLKGPKGTSGCAALAVRPEEEMLVPDELAEAITCGQTSPLDVLPKSALVEMVKSALAGDQLVLQEEQGFSNVRVHAPFELVPPSGAQPIVVTLELDTTTFSFRGVNEVHWEVECELQDLVTGQSTAGASTDSGALEERAREVEAALQALLVSIPEIGAPCPAAKGKRSRHKAFLKTQKKEAKAKGKARHR